MRLNIIKERRTLAAKFVIKAPLKPNKRVVKIKLVSERIQI